MADKPQKSNADAPFANAFAGAVKDSAQQIWLAGLGAFSKAQEEGGKVFENLVKDGLTLQRKTQTAAELRLAEATSKMTKMASMATEIQSKAGNQWDKLENIFEDRVAKALKKLEVPSVGDIKELQTRVEELTRMVQQLSATAQPKAKIPSPAPITQRTQRIKPDVVSKSSTPQVAAKKTARKSVKKATRAWFK